MRTLLALLSIGSWFWAGTALATIPTIDAAQLTQHARTSSAIVHLVPIVSQRRATSFGVHCAVTTGKKASVSDPAVEPQKGAGSRLIQSYAPDMLAAAFNGAPGAASSIKTLFDAAGEVAAGLDAGSASTAATLAAFQTASRQVGTATTVMAALDMNAAARLQNGFAWNSTIGAANLWLQALNARNLVATSDASRAAIAMRTTVTASPSATDNSCPVGLLGSGTATGSCRTGPCTVSSSADPACTSSSLTSGSNNLVLAMTPPGASAASRLATRTPGAR